MPDGGHFEALRACRLRDGWIEVRVIRRWRRWDVAALACVRLAILVAIVACMLPVIAIGFALLFAITEIVAAAWFAASPEGFVWTEDISIALQVVTPFAVGYGILVWCRERLIRSTAW